MPPADKGLPRADEKASGAARLTGRTAWVWCGIAALIALGILLRSQHMTDVPWRSPDERVYTDYAATLADDGLVGYREAFRAYNADPGRWLYPPPTRFGYVILPAMVMQATGVRNPRAGAAISWLSSILSLVVLGWLGIRFLSPWASIAAVGFLACSFTELGLGRRAWQDSFLGLLSLLMVYVVCEITHSPRRKWLYVALAALGAYSLASKESAYVQYGVLLSWLAYVGYRERSWRVLGGAALAGAGSVAVVLAVWNVTGGSLGSGIEATSHVLAATRGSVYDAQNASGPWYQFVYLLWLVGPLTLMMALVGMGAALIPRVGDALHRRGTHCLEATQVAALTTAALLGIISFGPNLQNLRYFSGADATYCLLAGVGFAYAVAWVRTVFRRELAIALLAVTCLGAEAIHNYHAFTQVVVGTGMGDLAVSGVRTVMRR